MASRDAVCPHCGEVLPATLTRCRYCRGELKAAPVGASACEPPREAERSSSPTNAPEAVILQDRRKRPPERVPDVRTSAVKEAQPSPSALPLVEPAPASAPGNRRDPTWLVLGGLLVLLLAPLMVSGPLPGEPPLSWGLPAVHSGDEPHYLVLLNSVLNDGDLDVANNYLAVHAGGFEAGRKFRGWALDHHVTWYWHEHPIQWWEAYETDMDRWERDANGHPVPTLRKDSIHRPVSAHEYSQHGPGLALALAPLLWPVRGTGLVEPAALLLAGLVTWLGAVSFFQLIRPYAATVATALGVTAVAYLGTPLWHYSRTFFTEPFVAAAVVTAYADVLRRDRYLPAGLLLGWTVLVKTPFLVLAVPLLVDAAFRRDGRGLARLATPLAAAVAIVLWWNVAMRNGLLHMPLKWEWALPLEGVFGILLHWQSGILLFAPVLLLAAVVVPEWYRRYPREALVLGSAVVLHLALVSSYAQWWAGYCYSSRFMVAVLPLALVPLALLPGSELWRRSRAVRWGMLPVVGLSVLFSGVAAFACEHVWMRHPLQLLLTGP